MKVKQLSIFIENKSGRLARVARSLAEASVNIRALSIADTSDFGILRLIVDDPDKGLAVLKDNGFAVSVAEVIAVAIPDVPGGLAEVLSVLLEKNIGIEYMYAFVGQAAGKALVVLRVEAMDDAIEALTAAGVTVVRSVDV